MTKRNVTYKITDFCYLHSAEL